ncbi:hypothetical protein M885DRAFT_618127 [Pelagophyceae sp. CCMP2097]|nr:hypothetical protein M885DRAFT_618127 [Pelagophyceae sp. CCMP2097]
MLAARCSVLVRRGAIAAAPQRCRAVPGGVEPMRRWLALKTPPDDQKVEDRKDRLVFDSSQQYKFQSIAAFGSVYTMCWGAYVVSDVYLNPTGSIGANTSLIATIGFTSLAVGAFVMHAFAGKTVGKLQIMYTPGHAEELEVTTYTPIGGILTKRSPISTVIPQTPLDQPNRLRTFALEDDPNKSYIVLIDQPTDVKDARVFDRLMFIEDDYKFKKKPEEGFSMRRRRPTHRERPSEPRTALNADAQTNDKPNGKPTTARPPGRRPRPHEP